MIFQPCTEYAVTKYMKSAEIFHLILCATDMTDSHVIFDEINQMTMKLYLYT